MQKCNESLTIKCLVDSSLSIVVAVVWKGRLFSLVIWESDTVEQCRYTCNYEGQSFSASTSMAAS